MTKSHELLTIAPTALLAEVEKLQKENWRMIQICATDLTEIIEVSYSFGKDLLFKNLKIEIKRDEELESVSSMFAPASLYENEIHDLFGVKINNIQLDYKGQLYKISETAPFANAPKKEAE